MILPFVWRDIREQYAGSLGGVIWSVCQPLFLIFLYWWVFSKILRVRIPIAEGAGSLPFIVFLLSALLPWFAFQDGLMKGTSAIIGHRDVVKKVHFPVIVFPLAAVIAACINHGIGYGIFLVVFFIWQNHLSIEQLTAIAAILMLQIFFTAGLAVLFAAIAVYLRDVIQIIGLVLPALFYTSPILYPLSLVPENWQSWVSLNPFTLFAEAYHHAVLDGGWPTLSTSVLLILLAGSALWGGKTIFRRLQPGFSDVL